MTFNKAKNLTVDTNVNNNTSTTTTTSVSTPSTTSSMTPSNKQSSNNNTNNNNNVLPTPKGIRGSSDLRSPGVQKTPMNTSTSNTNNTNDSDDDMNMASSPLANFITQTDKYGNASTPRIPITKEQPDTLQQNGTDETDQSNNNDVDACDTLLDSLRMMCCCILPNEQTYYGQQQPQPQQQQTTNENTCNGKNTSHTQVLQTPMKQILKEDVDVPHNICLLPEYTGEKKCLVLDLDETLVHSSFRAVAGADFVIPVQIEEVVHFVYVIKRPGVDEFLLEMSKHYEIVVYTASLNKYADPLLDLLDPHHTIDHRLFRESCVYYEGSYVKDLSLLNRNLKDTIIIDNSPASYLFHPENAIDCSSFIDDLKDRELHQIGSFLKGMRNVDDVRGVMQLWKEWPRIESYKVNKVLYPKDLVEEERLLQGI